jgi:hypothetical protein
LGDDISNHLNACFGNWQMKIWLTFQTLKDASFDLKTTGKF